MHLEKLWRASETKESSALPNLAMPARLKIYFWPIALALGKLTLLSPYP